MEEIRSLLYYDCEIKKLQVIENAIMPDDYQGKEVIPYGEADGSIWFAILNKKGQIVNRINSRFVVNIEYTEGE